jgi:hypothetical protein
VVDSSYSFLTETVAAWGEEVPPCTDKSLSWQGSLLIIKSAITDK